MNNFNPKRLSAEPYPKNDRPIGKKDLLSVEHHLNILKNGEKTTPIYILYTNKKYILLDGAHRIVSNYLFGNKKINAIIINKN